MIDIGNETLLTLTEAAKRLPTRRGGKRVHPSTLFRWVSHGFRGIRLEYVQVGGTKCTSIEAIERFFQLCTTETDPAGHATTSRSKARKIKQSKKRLEERGW